MAAALFSRANAASRTILDRVKGMKLGRAQTMVLTDSFSLAEQDVRVCFIGGGVPGGILSESRFLMKEQAVCSVST